MKILWESTAWEDYLYWQKNDTNTLKRINTLIKACEGTPYSGIGKPELLKRKLKGYWSRRIDKEHRLVYKADNEIITIVQCRFHY